MFLRLSNILGDNGYIDYKGLDVSRFVPGSQHYKMDTSYCVLETTQDEILQSDDVMIIDQSQYLIEAALIKSECTNIKTDEQKELDKQQAQIDELTLMLGDLVLGGDL